MEDQNVILEILNQYPWLIYLALGLILVLALVAIFQGREVSIFGLRLGGKQSTESDEPHPLPIPTQQQAQTVQVITADLTPEQVNMIADRLAERVEPIRREVNNQPPDLFYQPPELPERLAYVYSARNEIERKVRTLVLSHGGAWAGSSMAPFDIYLDHALTGKVISQELFNDITNFYYMYTQPMINFGHDSDESYLNIQYLAADINRKLDAITPGELAEYYKD